MSGCVLPSLCLFLVLVLAPVGRRTPSDSRAPTNDGGLDRCAGRHGSMARGKAHVEILLLATILQGGVPFLGLDCAQIQASVGAAACIPRRCNEPMVTVCVWGRRLGLGCEGLWGQFHVLGTCATCYGPNPSFACQSKELTPLPFPVLHSPLHHSPLKPPFPPFSPSPFALPLPFDDKES